VRRIDEEGANFKGGQSDFRANSGRYSILLSNGIEYDDEIDNIKSKAIY